MRPGMGVTALSGGASGGERVMGSVITGGTNFGNMTNGGGLADCFDGDTNDAGGLNTSNPSYLGKTISRRVWKAIWWGVATVGVIQDANPSTTITLRGQVGGSAPSDNAEAQTFGVEIATLTFTDDALNTPHEMISTDNETLFDHIWSTVAATGGVERRCSELQIYEAL